MSKKSSKQEVDMTFEESLKRSSKKELRKICRHFQEMNIYSESTNYELSQRIQDLQDKLAQEHSTNNHKTRLLEALAKS